MRKILPYFVITLILAAVAMPLASTWPDGLDRVAQMLGFQHRALSDPVVKAPLPDYGVPGLEKSPWSGSLAGLAGTLICFIIPFGFYLRRRK
jgi:cobalt/nickel transport protein